MTLQSVTQNPNRDSLIIAPWTAEQVDALNYFQSSGALHPFTSGSTGEVLIATENGWVEFKGGPVVQDWAHSVMTNKLLVQQQIELINSGPRSF